MPRAPGGNDACSTDGFQMQPSTRGLDRHSDSGSSGHTKSLVAFHPRGDPCPRSFHCFINSPIRGFLSAVV